MYYTKSRFKANFLAINAMYTDFANKWSTLFVTYLLVSWITGKSLVFTLEKGFFIVVAFYTAKRLREVFLSYRDQRYYYSKTFIRENDWKEWK